MNWREQMWRKLTEFSEKALLPDEVYERYKGHWRLLRACRILQTSSASFGQLPDRRTLTILLNCSHKIVGLILRRLEADSVLSKNSAGNYEWLASAPEQTVFQLIEPEGKRYEPTAPLVEIGSIPDLKGGRSRFC